MMLGRLLYRWMTRIVSLMLGTILRRRVKSGKEDAARLNERRARKLPPRPAGRVVWLHGASVGESLILLELGKILQAEAPDIHLVYTSQTQTSAELVADHLPERAFQQMAPIDTPGGAKRFIRHWQPALGIVAESEIWPNLLRRAKKRGARLALVNARMTNKSLKGWARWPRTAQNVFSLFDVILAADEQTASGLEQLTGAEIRMPGNLKSSLPPPDFDPRDYDRLKAAFKDIRACLLAASTHEGEESLVLDALEKMDERPALIIAPRHPERGDEIESLIKARGLSISRRSRGDAYSTETDVLLADTLGEMGLWYRLADTIYLGGAHTPGVGGHNPLEALKLGKTLITGPDAFNFADMMQTLEQTGAVRIAEDAGELATLVPLPATVDEAALTDWLKQANYPMQETLKALLDLLEAPE